MRFDRLSRLIAPVFLTLTIAACGPFDVRGDEAADFFEARIRPVLVKECQGCHGAEDPEAGLSLLTRESLLKGGEQGPAAVPGQPGESLILTAIEHRDGMKMPPKGKRLDQHTIDDFRRWIASGLAFPASNRPAAGLEAKAAVADHWAFLPLKKAEPGFAQDDPAMIDHWIEREIRKQGLRPTPAAERFKLIRRATLALHGLPPTPDEVDRFVADTGTDEAAFDRLVTRLLASPRFGERWARHWLDLARYSDTKGYVFFEESDFPWSYTYRDYVIRSFSEDKPYDRFVKEQIAADRLTDGPGGRENLAALGFLTLGNRYMNNPHDIIDDRIDVVTRPLLGLSVTCARCHDHKFDPIASEDYYALYGIFANSVEPLLPPELGPAGTDEAARKIAGEIAAAQANLRNFVESKYDELVEKARRRAGDYLLAAETSRRAPKTDDFMLIADGDDLNPTLITQWRAFLEKSRKKEMRVMRTWNACADAAEAEFSQTLARHLGEETNPILKAAIVDRSPANLAELAQAYGESMRKAYFVWREFRERGFAAGSGEPIRHEDPFVEELRQVLDGPDSPVRVVRNPMGDLTLLPDRASQAELKKRIDAFEKARRAKGAPVRAQMLTDRPTAVETRLFVRGNPQNEGKEVERRFLSMFEGTLPKVEVPPGQSGRLQIAEAVANPANPLTARVYVNRVWHILFGRGLVATPGDFGIRGEPPSHPELLDALALDFMKSGWSTKQLIRRIMLSQTYRRSTLPPGSSEALANDPRDQYLAWSPIRRSDYETMRDSALYVSGLLDMTVGGPSSGSAIDASFRRRAIYGRIDRLNLPEQLRTFDFPEANALAVERASTSTPGQALFLMNHPLLRVCAEGLVQRSAGEGSADDSAMASRMARLAWQRSPSSAELAEISEFLTTIPGDGRERLIALAQLFLMSNEFHFTD
ncbi:DUF1549 domain-containing protein [bacterium]|nr:DUF1549 domain-containing protein [bacterium]